ncbi:AaceriAFR315Cp [[Ashbya] aceris (nom. inval.)]|nr:AaceriAFR315Cp [[Ashbya] aceris (nom. inval.)]
MSRQQFFRRLPRVPSTQHLPADKMQLDIFFSRHRPLTYPITQNPLFRRRPALLSFLADPAENKKHDDGNRGNSAARR